MAAELIAISATQPVPPAPLIPLRSPVPAACETALRELSAAAGLPLLCFDIRTSRILTQTDPRQLPLVPRNLARRLATAGGVQVFPGDYGLTYFAMPFQASGNAAWFAVGYVLNRPDARPRELVLAAVDRGWDESELTAFLTQMPYCHHQFLEQHLNLACERIAKQRSATIPEHLDVDTLVQQLEHTHEEIGLLHSLTQNMQISRSPSELAELALERLSGVMHAQCHAIWLDPVDDKPVFLLQGEPIATEDDVARLVSRFDDHDWTRPLIKNSIPGTLLGSEFPALRNFCLLPILEGNRRFGWMFSCNLRGRHEFSFVEASLLTSVVSLLATHNRNIDLYNQHEDLLLCFVRSLVSSLDAKDPYTRGHSERVALIAQRLGAQLHLPEEDLRDIYLSGLLHDIGKIGVDDQILRKPGQLTREEFDQVKKHPIIGYNILAGLKNLRRVIPGVRHHHESWNGKGYPDGLAGDVIPLMARIMAVADSYDAMGSDRPYRQGMPLEQLEEILQRGAGHQWDPRVVAAYFACRDEIHELCKAYDQNASSVLPEPVNNKDFASLSNSMTTATLRAALHAVSTSRR